MPADSGSVYEVAFALEKGRDVTEELPGKAIYLCEGIFEVSRFCPDTGCLQYNFVNLCQRSEDVRVDAVVFRTCSSSGIPE